MKKKGIEKLIFEKDLVKHLKKILGLKGTEDVFFDIEFVDNIPSSPSGRLQAVVSEIKTDS